MPSLNRRIVIYYADSPGPTQCFDTTDGKFIDETQLNHLHSK